MLSQRPGRSGSGVFLNAMVREGARRGHQQHVVVAGPSGTTHREVPPLDASELTLIEFPCHEAPFAVPGNSDVMPYPNTVFSQMTEAQVQQYLNVSRSAFEEVRSSFKPDIVHCHHLWLLTSLVRDVFPDVPTIATSHNAELRQLVKAPHLARRVLPGIRALDRVCVLTPQSVEDTVHAFGVARDRIAVTGAGFRGDLFAPFNNSRRALREKLEAQFEVRVGPGIDDPQRCRVVTFVGRLSTPKGLPFLLRAVKRLQRPGVPAFKLMLVGASGSGEDGQEMDRLVAGAGPDVIHIGALPQEGVALALQCSDVFVLPSLFEGLPLTMLEAAASGCACLLSELPTIASWVPREWLAEGHFAFVPRIATTHADVAVEEDVPRYVGAIADALERMIQLPRSATARNALAAELRNHTWARVFEGYERVYSEIVA